MSEQFVYLNGDILPLEQARVSPMDRGFLFGDGVYEVIPVYQKRLFEWTAHLTRLKYSLNAVKINNPLDDQAWYSMLNDLVERHPWSDQFIYLQVTRGIQIPRDHLPAKNLTPTVYAYTNPLTPVSDSILKDGIKVITVEDIRWHRCDIKAITLLPNVMMKLAAEEAEADDAILVRPNGDVTEGSASNLFMIKDQKIITPPSDQQILTGITRQVIEKLADRHHISFIERNITQTELEQADELWLASSTREIIAVTELNKKPVGNGMPGPIWTLLHPYYQDYKMDIIQSAL